MNKSVVVTANEAGAVVIPSVNNPEFGYIRLEQERSTMENGWFRKSRVSAIISGEMTQLKAAGFHKGQVLPGKIYVTESLEPFNKENPEKDYKYAGETGVICSVEGNPIYRRAYYTEDLSLCDTLIPHDNKLEIQEAQEAMEKDKENQEKANAGDEAKL